MSFLGQKEAAPHLEEDKEKLREQSPGCGGPFLCLKGLEQVTPEVHADPAGVSH